MADGIIGANFAPESKSLEYSHTVEEVMQEIWDNLDEQSRDLFSRENDYNNGVHSLRDYIFGLHSFNLEMYDLTENSPEGSGDTEGFHVEIDTILEIADTCFECAEIYEDVLIPLIGVAQQADSSLADESGDEGYADPKVKELVEEYREYLKTACGRLYTAGDQIKDAAEAYAATDDERQAAFESVMEDWDEGAPPGHADDWAGDTDRSGWDPDKGHPYLEGSKNPGYADAGDYETELSAE